jgi:iron complex transport system permease protein
VPASGALALASALLAVAVLCSLLVGPEPVPPAALLHLDHPGADPDVLVLRHLRLPRTITGVLAGSGLGVAGVLLIGLTRNPLADPGIVGINAGAALAVVVGIAVLGVAGMPGLAWCALVGAALAGVVVHLLGSAGRGASPASIAIAGAAVSAALAAITTAVTLADRTTFAAFRFWNVGALGTADPAALRGALPFLVAGLALAVGVAPVLDVLALGDDVAAGLGARLGLVRAATAAAAVLLAGTAVALAGPIAFVGLAVPHAARLLVGVSHRRQVLVAVLLGPVVVLLADTVGRLVLAPREVQAGLVTALVGAPVLIALVRRRLGVGG